MLPVANSAKVENVLQVREHVSDNATGHGGAGLGQGLSLLPTGTGRGRTGSSHGRRGWYRIASFGDRRPGQWVLYGRRVTAMNDLAARLEALGTERRSTLRAADASGEARKLAWLTSQKWPAPSCDTRN